jgi:hypothetical protein
MKREERLGALHEELPCAKSKRGFHFVDQILRKELGAKRCCHQTAGSEASAWSEEQRRGGRARSARR